MKKTISLFIFLFCLTNCAPKKDIAQNANFKYVDGNEKIEFEILTGNNYLKVNVPTLTKFKFQNIEPKNVTLAGRTIRALSFENNEIIVEMSPEKKDLENGNLVIRLTYKINKEFKKFILNVPVKE